MIPLCRGKYFPFQYDAVVVEQHRDGMTEMRVQDAIQRHGGGKKGHSTGGVRDAGNSVVS